MITYSGGDSICRDWKVTDRGPMGSWPKDLARLSTNTIRSLKPGNLYYDAGYSQTPPRPYWGKLDRLSSISHFIFEASVWPDRELGWAIFPDYWRKSHPFLPRPGGECEISLDEKRIEFKAIEAGTSIPARVTVTSKGEFEAVDCRVQAGTIVLYCPKSPASLRNWLDKYFAVDRMLGEESKIVAVIGGGITVFVEVLETRRLYSLRPALHYYPSQVIDKSLLDSRLSLEGAITPF